MTGHRSWDLFCRVIDNFGDAGVCWRLARDLTDRGERVRLWIDDPAPLTFMAPGGTQGVEIVPWTANAPELDPADVVIEAFGCEPPPDFVVRMAARLHPPVWINLEHLSAEAWVERSHALPSPQRNGLIKWFYFPGFTPKTGGLLREPGLLDERNAFDRTAWLGTMGVALHPGERVVAIFCYENTRLQDLLDALADQPTRVLATPGLVQRQLAHLRCPRELRIHALPWIDHAGFDRLLWSADINVVRGEDSIVRAIWAGAPCVWHIYPQHDLAHDAKLMALLRLATGGLPACDAEAITRLWRRFNGLEPGVIAMPDPLPWRAAMRALRSQLAAQTDLATQLLAFAAGKS